MYFIKQLQLHNLEFSDVNIDVVTVTLPHTHTDLNSQLESDKHSHGQKYLLFHKHVILWRRPSNYIQIQEPQFWLKHHVA